MSTRSLFTLLVTVVLGCGGSSSETPWPAEPEGSTLGPAGETTRDSLDDIPRRRDAGGEPSVEP